MPGPSPQSPLPDVELLQQAASGDGEAFAALFERYRHVVYRFARAMTGSPDAAEDVTQEVFVILMRELSRYVPERSAFSTYLYGIARNVSRDRVRRERRFLSLDTLGLSVPERLDGVPRVSPFERLVDQEAGAEVRRALAQLPDRYREVVILCDLHDLSYAQVAAVVRASVAAVRARLHRGRHLLRRRLRRSEPESARPGARFVRWSV
jgi:RNA polymerase sigma-70 factor, ECF subfamily